MANTGQILLSYDGDRTITIRMGQYTFECKQRMENSMVWTLARVVSKSERIQRAVATNARRKDDPHCYYMTIWALEEATSWVQTNKDKAARVNKG